MGEARVFVSLERMKDISKYRLRSLIRSLGGFGGALLPQFLLSRPRLYINLRGRNPVGGPHRFLRNLSEILSNQGISISSITPKGCDAALVFSVSWGRSFKRLCRLLKVRSVLRVDGFFHPEVYSASGRMRPLAFHSLVNDRLREDISRFDHIIYQSEFSKRQADQYLFKREGGYSIIHNGIDTQFLIPAKKTTSGKLTMLSLRTYSRGEVDFALGIFEEVRNRVDSCLVLAGPMRDMSASLVEYVGSHRIGGRYRDDIHCIGIVPYAQLPSFFSWGHVFLHLKPGDWCPNAVLESLSCGTPVVCPAWGGQSELIGSGGIAVQGSQWKITEDLIHGMAEAVFRIVNDSERYALEARSAAVKRFERIKVAKEYLQVVFPGGC